MLSREVISLQVQEAVSQSDIVVRAELNLAETATVPRGDSDALAQTKQQLVQTIWEAIYTEIDLEVCKLELEISRLEVSNSEQLKNVIGKCAEIRKKLTLSA